jgi:dienelactone hydrolase
VAFVALASAAVLPDDQVKAYAELTGGSGSDTPFPSKQEITKRLQDTGSSGADPKPYLEQLRIPALWRYGTADREVPVDQRVALLDRLKAQGKDFTVVTFPMPAMACSTPRPPTPRHRQRSSTGSDNGSEPKLRSVPPSVAAT